MSIAPISLRFYRRLMLASCVNPDYFIAQLLQLTNSRSGENSLSPILRHFFKSSLFYICPSTLRLSVQLSMCTNFFPNTVWSSLLKILVSSRIFSIIGTNHGVRLLHFDSEPLKIETPVLGHLFANSLARSLARIAHLFICSILPASLAPCASCSYSPLSSWDN